jgi:hypothetical protein
MGEEKFDKVFAEIDTRDHHGLTEIHIRAKNYHTWVNKEA